MKLFIRSLLVLAVALCSTARAEVKLGNEVLAAEGFKVLQGKRVGLLTNPSGVNRKLDSTIDVLRAAPGVKLVALFGPEHGVYGAVGAGDKVADTTDSPHGVAGVFALRQDVQADPRDAQRPGCHGV